MHTKAITLRCGATVTVTPFPFSEAVAAATDFNAVVDALTADVRGQPSPLPDRTCLTVLARLVRASLTRSEDERFVTAADLPELLHAIWNVNGLRDYAKKHLRQALRAQAARANLFTS